MQYIGIVLAIGVWIYFEFYRIPSVIKSLQIEHINDTLTNHGTTIKSHSRDLKDCDEVFAGIWEKIDEFDQKFDVGTKTSPKAIARNQN